jgi:hypothetical protein
MAELEITWERVVCVWWLVLWRSLIGGFVVGICVAAPFVLLAETSGDVLHSPFFTLAGIIGPLAIYFGWWPVVIHMALKKRYSGFRIALVPTTTRV